MKPNEKFKGVRDALVKLLSGMQSKSLEPTGLCRISLLPKKKKHRGTAYGAEPL
jgi:hypothetical protein